MTQKYRAASKDDLIWHGLDGMMLLFHRPSGLTHMLADPVPAIFEVMQDSPLTAAEIALRLTAAFEVEAGVDPEDVVVARLEELSGLGLMARVPG